jgi:hypothetical protein
MIRAFDLKKYLGRVPGMFWKSWRIEKFVASARNQTTIVSQPIACHHTNYATPDLHAVQKHSPTLPSLM